jgi:hypothetical protein
VRRIKEETRLRKETEQLLYEHEDGVATGTSVRGLKLLVYEALSCYMSMRMALLQVLVYGALSY